MPIDWSALTGSKISPEDGLPEHFGNASAELAAAADDKLSLVSVTDRAWIRCSGPDARAFLHNQVTSDVNHLAVGHWQYSAWCTAKGRMLANFILLHRVSDTFDLCLPAELAAPLLKRFRMFVLRSKVVFEDLSDKMHTLGVKGNVADCLRAAGLPATETVGDGTEFEHGWIVRTAIDRCLIALTDPVTNDFLKRLTVVARPVGTQAWHWLEVRSGLALVRQSTQEEFVPQMVNFDKIGGVSFHKGCYPGQEVVARTQYLGKVKRHLYFLHSAQPLAPGQSLFHASTDSDANGSCGIIANAAPSPQGGWDGLAVILENAVGEAIHAGAPNGPNISNIDLVAA